MKNFIARTYTGSCYEFEDRDDCYWVRRLDATDPLRRDGEWLRVDSLSTVEIGKPLIIQLEPLGEAPLTIRITSAVVSIKESK